MTRKALYDSRAVEEMGALLMLIVQALVDHPAKVYVGIEEREESVRFLLRVEPNDVGKVIGRRGRMAHSIRTLLRAAAVRNRLRFVLDIIEEE